MHLRSLGIVDSCDERVVVPRLVRGFFQQVKVSAGALGNGVVKPALDPFAFHVNPRRLIEEYDNGVVLGPFADLFIEVFTFLRIKL